MAKKNFLLDTNVLLSDPGSIHAFEDNDVYLLLSVLEELDSKKRDPGSLGVNARTVARDLDELRKKGNLGEGVELEGGGVLRVLPYKRDGLDLDFRLVDNQLLSTALKLHQETLLRSVVVTKDVSLRVRADGVGIDAEDYRHGSLGEHCYMGHSTIEVDSAMVDALYKDEEVQPPVFGLLINQYVNLVAAEHPQQRSCIGRVTPRGTVVPVPYDSVALGLHPKNIEQRYALHALLNDNLQLLTLQGRAGTGKTLLAVAAAFSKVLADQYSRVLITRPVVHIGQEVGFLPGDIAEKMKPWMQPIYDAIDILCMADARSGRSKMPAKYDELLEMVPLDSIRGRSLSRAFIIIDEAQNLTPHEVKTLITRAGGGSKVVLTGDVEQIDHPYLDARSNGFSCIVSRFKGNPVYAHVTLTKGERSQLAEMAAALL